MLTAATYSAMLALQATVRIAAGGPHPEDGVSGLAFAIAPTFVTALVLARRAHRRGLSPRDLGFVRPRSWRPVVVAWLGAVFAGPLTAWGSALGAVPGAILGVSHDGSSARALTLNAAANGSLEVVVLALLVSSAVPLTEEFIFRGMLHRTLRSAWPQWPFVPSAILSGTVFALAHFDLATALPLFIVGFIFAWSYERTGSLWGSIVPHGGLNALTILVEVTRP